MGAHQKKKTFRGGTEENRDNDYPELISLISVISLAPQWIKPANTYMRAFGEVWYDMAGHSLRNGKRALIFHLSNVVTVATCRCACSLIYGVLPVQVATFGLISGAPGVLVVLVKSHKWMRFFTGGHYAVRPVQLCAADDSRTWYNV